MYPVVLIFHSGVKTGGWYLYGGFCKFCQSPLCLFLYTLWSKIYCGQTASHMIPPPQMYTCFSELNIMMRTK